MAARQRTDAFEGRADVTAEGIDAAWPTPHPFPLAAGARMARKSRASPAAIW